jgi:hypothetical protein
MKIFVKLFVEAFVCVAFVFMLVYSIFYGGELYSFRGDPASFESAPVKYVFNFVVHLLVILAFGVSGWFSLRKIRRNISRNGKVRDIS